MNLWSRIKRRREQLDRWEIKRLLDGVNAVQARTMRQIASGVNREVFQYSPPGWKEFRLGLTDWLWFLRLWIELNVQLMR
jgi:hypothetical protein